MSIWQQPRACIFHCASYLQSTLVLVCCQILSKSDLILQNAGLNVMSAQTDPCGFTPALLSLLHVPRAQVQQLFELQCLLEAANKGVSPSCASAELGIKQLSVDSGLGDQLLSGALVVVQHRTEEEEQVLKLRRVLQVTKAAANTNARPQNQGPKCQLKIQVSVLLFSKLPLASSPAGCINGFP